MRKTSQYQLNQWDAEDRILREDFNRDNANVEAGLAALNTALETAKSEAAGNLAAERTQRQQADAAKADTTALNALSAKMDNTVAVVKLASIVTSADAAQVDVDVSQWPLSEYARLIIIPQLSVDTQNSTQTVRLLCNGLATENGYRINDSRCSYLYSMNYNSAGKSCCTLCLMGDGSNLYMIGENIYFTGTRGLVTAHDFCAVMPTTLTQSQLQTLNLVCTTQILAGSRILILGVK